ncbi:MAG: hypothetical protein WC686_00475 [Candidatus Shapirobacteria bacterium]|jgi:hypothetical protein
MPTHLELALQKIHEAATSSLRPEVALGAVMKMRASILPKGSSPEQAQTILAALNLAQQRLREAIVGEAGQTPPQR